MKSTSLLYGLIYQVLDTLLAPSTHWFVRLISLLAFVVLATLIIISLVLDQPEQLNILAVAVVTILTAPPLWMIVAFLALVVLVVIRNG